MLSTHLSSAREVVRVVLQNCGLEICVTRTRVTLVTSSHTPTRSHGVDEGQSTIFARTCRHLFVFMMEFALKVIDRFIPNRIREIPTITMDTTIIVNGSGETINANVRGRVVTKNEGHLLRSIWQRTIVRKHWHPAAHDRLVAFSRAEAHHKSQARKGFSAVGMFLVLLSLCND